MTKPEAETRDASVLFCEVLKDPAPCGEGGLDSVVLLMNDYSTEMVDCVLQHDGMVNEYIGDTLFAVWNLPFTVDHHQHCACRGMLAMMRAAEKLANQRTKERVPLSIRMGLHCGPVVWGLFGGSQRKQQMVLGSTVNLANQLIKINDWLGTTAIISDDVKSSIHDSFVTREVGSFALKGPAQPKVIHELLGSPEAWETRAWRGTFAEALAKFRARDWAGAITGFNEVLNLKPADGPARFYLRRIEDLQRNPPGPDWHGQIELYEQ